MTVAASIITRSSCFFKWVILFVLLTYSWIFENANAKQNSVVLQAVFWPKTPKVDNVKLRVQRTIAFFFSPLFSLLATSISLLLFLRQCDFRAYRAQKPVFWLFFDQIAANFIWLVFKRYKTYKRLFFISKETFFKSKESNNCTVKFVFF